MKMIRLTAENVKRLKAVRIEPRDATTVIGGKNGAGKTSVLDAIEMALAGKSHAPAQPVRRGQEKATIVVELDDLIVKRTFSADGKSALTVESKAGAKYPSPQAMLDKLVGNLSFDPLAFMRMKPKEQAETLRRLVGLDTSDLDAKREKAYADRTKVNAQADAAKAQLDAMPSYNDAPSQPIDVSGLMEEYKAGHATNKANAEVRDTQAKWLRFVEQKAERLKIAEAALESAKKEAKEALDGLAIANEAADGLEEVDLYEINKEIAEAGETNLKVKANADRLAKGASLAALAAQSAKLTAEIKTIDADRSARIAAVEFPVDGLAIGDDGVMFNDIPLVQCATSEQLRVSTSIGFADNPELRLMLIRDASLLDSDGRAALNEMAIKFDSQILMESVCEDASGCHVFIEDGEVKESAVSDSGRRVEL